MKKTGHLTIKMKAFLAFLVVFLGVANAFATDVIFHLYDPQFGVSQTTNRTVIVQAEQYQGTASAQLLPFRLTQITDATGSTTFSNLFGSTISGLYHVIIPGPPQMAQFDIWVSATNLGQIYASSNLITLGTQTYPAGAWAWSASASDARYQFNGTTLSNTFYPLFSNPNNYVTPVTAGNYAVTNVSAGANMTITTNGGTVVFASSGSGAATNAINIINGAGSGTTLTNATLLGNVTATNLIIITNGFVDARITNGLTSPGITNSLASIVYAQSLTNGLTDQRITNGLATTAYALTLTNGFTDPRITNGLTSPGITNGLASTQALQAATNQSQLNLNSTNTVLLLVIQNSTNNQFVPINQGPFYDTNKIVVAANPLEIAGVYVLGNSGVFTNVSFGTTAYVTNNGSYFFFGGSSTPYPIVNFTNINLVGNYTLAGNNFNPTNISVNYAFAQPQPATANSTNWSTLTTNNIGTYWPTMVQLNTASNAVLVASQPATLNLTNWSTAGTNIFTTQSQLGVASNALQSQITSAGITLTQATNVASAQVLAATNGFGGIVTAQYSLTNTFATTNLLNSATNLTLAAATNAGAGIFGTLIVTPTNNAVVSAILQSTNSVVQSAGTSFYISRMPLAQLATTNWIYTYGGTYDGNALWLFSSANNWTNTVDSRYSLNLSAGNLNILSNAVQLYTLVYANFPTNFSGGSSNPGGTAPIGSYGSTNYLGVVPGNPLFTGSPTFSGSMVARGVFTGNGAGLTNLPTIITNPPGVVYSVSANGIVDTNLVTAAYRLIDTNFNEITSGSNSAAHIGGGQTNDILAMTLPQSTAAAQAVVNLNSTNILYVSANGSAANNGTFSSPFGLLSQAISNQFTGCIIKVNAGTYVDQITSEQLLYTNVCIDASPGAIIIITNEIPSGIPAAICGSLSNTISGGQWFMYMTNYTVSQWNTWCLFGNTTVNPNQFIIQHLRVTTPAAAVRFSVSAVATVNDCNLNAGYCGVVCVATSGSTLVNVMNTISSVTNIPPVGSSLVADWRTAYRLKGSNSGQMIIQNCAAIVSDQGLTSGNTNAYAIGQQVSGGTNQFIINGLTIDMSQCTNAASYHVAVLGSGVGGGSYLFNNVYDVNGAALTYTNLFSGNPKPWRSSPAD